MVQAENKHLQQIEHNVFASQYAARLLLHDFSGDELSESEQASLAKKLTASPSPAIALAIVDFSGETNYLEVISKIEADDTASALGTFSKTVVGALCSLGKDPECLTLVTAHVVYEEQLKLDQGEDSSVSILSARYEVGAIPIFELDDFGDQVTVSAREIFDTARGFYV